MMTAGELMTENPVTIHVRATVGQAERTLHTLDIRHLPVIDDDGQLVGMLSDRDLRGASIPSLLGDEPVGALRAAREASVASRMSSDVLAVDREDDLTKVVGLMLEHKIGAVPVVDGDGGVVGIVSYIDVLRELVSDAA